MTIEAISTSFAPAPAQTDPARWFSGSYAEATLRFRDAAQAAGLEVEAWTNPHLGPAGERLETLVTAFGPPDAAEVMVLCSGTHGTEALVGAGLQLGLLQDPDGFLAGAPDLRVVMIHIINPYGAAWGRYVNEDNVDLMKNLTYGDRVSPTALAFLDLDAAMDIASLGRPGAYEASLERRREVVRRWGMEGLNDALKRGQSARPGGICFNGVAASWSKRTLDAILTRRLAGARRVLYVDLHSGMGEFGEAYVVTSGDAASVALVRGWLGEAAHDSDVPMDPPTHSTLAACAPGAAFAAVTLEAGTETWDDEVREAMLFEMYYHLHGDRDCDHARQVKERFKRFYYPPSDDWRRRFWGNARAVLDVLKAGLAAWDGQGAGP